MSFAGHVNKGVVTQDNNSIDNGNDDASYMTDTDPADVHAQTIEVMRRAGAILEANGRGTREERAANRRRRFEEELNGDSSSISMMVMLSFRRRLRRRWSAGGPLDQGPLLWTRGIVSS
jgi:hypothetical protein